MDDKRVPLSDPEHDAWPIVIVMMLVGGPLAATIGIYANMVAGILIGAVMIAPLFIMQLNALFNPPKY